MILGLSRLGEGIVTVNEAPVVAASTAAIVGGSWREGDEDHPNIWPFVKAGVISGLTVYFLTRWLNRGTR